MKRMFVLACLLLSVTAWAVDYETEIQPIWNQNCSGCHGNSGGLSLAAGSSFDNLVDVVSQNYAPALRIAPGDAANSVLYNKITNSGNYGQQMPPSNALSPAEISAIETWITELGSLETISIAEARAMDDGETVMVQGIITTPNFGSATEYGLQDATGGIILFTFSFSAADELGLTAGDEILVTGNLDTYNGKKEVVPLLAADITILSSGNPLPAFQELTIAEIITNGEDYESELVIVHGVSIQGGDPWPDGGENANLDITDPSGGTMVMRIDKETEIDGTAEPEGEFTLQAIAGQYDNSEPYTDGYQLFPRYLSDFVFPDPAPVIADLDHAPDNPTSVQAVTVTATVTDNGTVTDVILNYVVNSGVEMLAVMSASGDVYSGTIPAQEASADVEYWVVATDDAGGVTTSETGSYSVQTVTGIAGAAVPETYALNNFPNPFNPSTTISFQIPHDQRVQLLVYNGQGKFVTELVNAAMAAGSYEMVWNGLDQLGTAVESGIYLYRLIAGDTQLTGKMTYLK